MMKGLLESSFLCALALKRRPTTSLTQRRRGAKMQPHSTKFSLKTTLDRRPLWVYCYIQSAQMGRWTTGALLSSSLHRQVLPPAVDCAAKAADGV